MSNFYAVCHLGETVCRVMLGTLHKGKLTLGEIRRFENLPVSEKDSLVWNIPQLYQETLNGLRQIGEYEEPVSSVSCTAWAADYLLFETDGTLSSPTYHHNDPRSEQGREAVLSKIPWPAIYDETAVQHTPTTTLCQLAAEKHRRLKRASHLMPIADGFNFLLSGVPCVELSSAATMQLYNPISRAWSERLLHALKLPRNLFPKIVPPGTELGPLRPEIAEATALTEARAVSSCSHEQAASLFGLPVVNGEPWAFLNLGSSSVMGLPVARPIVNDETRELGFSNQTCYGGSNCFHKYTAGLWILEQCCHYWKQRDRELNVEVLMHLAACAEPFESLINPSDPRFLEPDDMPSRIQGFCKEVGQPVPRKPGSIVRCILESLALHYRRTTFEMMQMTGREVTQLYVLGDSSNTLLNHFIANALDIPVLIASADAAAVGSFLVQGLALGHITSLDEAREIARQSCKVETIIAHPGMWDEVYSRFMELGLQPVEPVPVH